MRTQLAFISFLFVVGCAASNQGSRPIPDRGNSASELRQQIQQLQGTLNQLSRDKPCDSVDQCRSVAIGQKACGGPATYLVYSINGNGSDQLESLANRHRKLSRQYNKVTQAMSDCAVVMPPMLACVKGQCQSQ